MPVPLQQWTKKYLPGISNSWLYSLVWIEVSIFFHQDIMKKFSTSKVDFTKLNSVTVPRGDQQRVVCDFSTAGSVLQSDGNKDPDRQSGQPDT